MANPELIGSLERLADRMDELSSPLQAGLVREALEEIVDLRIALDEARHPVGVNGERDAADVEPEVYHYWITYQFVDKDPLGRNVASGTGVHELTRSTPILTFEDIRGVGEEIRDAPDRQHSGVSLLSFTLMKG